MHARCRKGNYTEKESARVTEEEEEGEEDSGEVTAEVEEAIPK